MDKKNMKIDQSYQLPKKCNKNMVIFHQSDLQKLKKIKK